MNPSPVVRFYQVRSGHEWARFFLTDDGCISIVSDYGDFAYWFGAPGGEFRNFLIHSGHDYLANKFAAGDRVVDEDETDRNVKREIIRRRREGKFDRETARSEWTLRADVDWADPVSAHEWHSSTELGEWVYHGEWYQRIIPPRITRFLKRLWPLFIEQLKAELAAEAA